MGSFTWARPTPQTAQSCAEPSKFSNVHALQRHAPSFNTTTVSTSLTAGSFSAGTTAHRAATTLFGFFGEITSGFWGFVVAAFEARKDHVFRLLPRLLLRRHHGAPRRNDDDRLLGNLLLFGGLLGLVLFARHIFFRLPPLQRRRRRRRRKRRRSRGFVVLTARKTNHQNGD
jgi:hypothetical protein